MRSVAEADFELVRRRNFNYFFGLNECRCGLGSTEEANCLAFNINSNLYLFLAGLVFILDDGTAIRAWLDVAEISEIGRVITCSSCQHCQRNDDWCGIYVL